MSAESNCTIAHLRHPCVSNGTADSNGDPDCHFAVLPHFCLLAAFAGAEADSESNNGFDALALQGILDCSIDVLEGVEGD